MFRLWGKTFLHNRMTNDLVVCNDSEESRTTKIFQAVTEICQTFDLSEPIWLDINIRDFKRHSKTRFTQDNFIDRIDFDYLCHCSWLQEYRCSWCFPLKRIKNAAHKQNGI